MIYYNAEKAFQFSWCSGCDLHMASGLLSAKQREVKRLCYLTTQVYRMYLVYIGSGEFAFWPYVYENGAWRRLQKHRWNIREFDSSVLGSEDNLRRALEFQMVLQFRDSIESYWGEFPSRDAVCDSIVKGATVETLDRYRYTYYPVEVQEDNEWDGAVEVYCDEGSLLYPYRDELGRRQLLVQYATFVPDSRLAYGFSSVIAGLDRVVSAVQNMHWSNFRLLVDKRGGN